MRSARTLTAHEVLSLTYYNVVITNVGYSDEDWYTYNWGLSLIPSLLPWGRLAGADIPSSVIGLADEPSPMCDIICSALVTNF